MNFCVYAYRFILSDGRRGFKIGCSRIPWNSYKQFRHKYGVKLLGEIEPWLWFNDKKQAFQAERRAILKAREKGLIELRALGFDRHKKKVVVMREAFLLEAG